MSLRVVRHKIGWGSYFVQKSGHFDDDVQISALDAFYRMDGRKSRYIREVLDWYRGEDAGDLKRSELNELVENKTCPNCLVGEMMKFNPKILTDEIINPKIVTNEKCWQTWKCNQNIAMSEELVQNSVMNEELVQNNVMNEKFVKNFLMNAGCNSLQPSNQNLLEDLIDENEPWLLIGIPSRDPFFLTSYLERHSVSSDQHMKNLMSLHEGLHMMMECSMRQHFAGCMNIQEDMHRGENLR